MEKKKKGFVQKAKQVAIDMLFPAHKQVSEMDSRTVDLPATSAGYADSLLSVDGLTDPVKSVFAATSDEEKVLHELPRERIAKYPYLSTMALDPTIDSAIKMHIANALGASEEKGEVISIESTGKADDPIVEELRNNFKKIINDNVQGWAYTTAELGASYIRIYGKPGEGVTRVRSDFYTHPRYMREFEQAGDLAGYTNAYQKGDKQLRLMAPWEFVSFKIPFWRQDHLTEPVRVAASEVDISSEEYSDEPLIESQNYGASLIETAYGPWLDLMEAILSLNMSRKNAAKLERVIGVHTGMLDPQRSFQYLNRIGKTITKAKEDRERASLRRGTVQTVVNHLIPVFGETGKGNLDINTVEGKADIDGIQDVMFHVNRLGSAVGVDPSLLGFGEQLSGGLGEGGFFRVSLLAGLKAQLLRKAIKTGLERLFEIHIAWKYGKVFAPGQKPYRIVFNSVSSALEREAQENLESKMNVAINMAQLPGMIDPDMQLSDKWALANYIWTDVMGMDEEKFLEVYPKALAEKAKKAKENPEQAEGMGSGGGMFESAFNGVDDDDLKIKIYNILEEYHNG